MTEQEFQQRLHKLLGDWYLMQLNEAVKQGLSRKKTKLHCKAK